MVYSIYLQFDPLPKNSNVVPLSQKTLSKLHTLVLLQIVFGTFLFFVIWRSILDLSTLNTSTSNVADDSTDAPAADIESKIC